MVQKSKWIDGLEPDAPISEAARHALDLRLRLVWYYLPLAAGAKIGDMEPIHQLRVSTRRAKAALQSFEQVLPERLGRWMDKQLKRVRKAAGDARDYDVLLARLTANKQKASGSDWQALTTRIRHCRRRAQQPIEKIFDRLDARNFKHKVSRLVEKTRWREDPQGDHEPTFAQVAREQLRAIVDPFLTAGSSLPVDIAVLHEFRIQGKQLRYAMEVFHSAFHPTFRNELYPQVEEIQEKLGEIIDHATALERFRGWRVTWDEPQLAGPIEQLLAEEESAIERAREAFAAWWSNERIADLRRRFDDVLASSSVGQVA